LSYNEQRKLAGLPERIEELEAEARQINTTAADPNFYREPANAIQTALARLVWAQATLDQACPLGELEVLRVSFRG